MYKIAVIGAGLSGLVAARDLALHHDVTVFEKSRGVGGRMATRYAGDFEFDHGAQFFTARSKAFRDFLAPHIDTGAVAVWQPAFAELRGADITDLRQWDNSTPHYVAAPRMNALARALARDLDVKTGVTVAPIRGSDDRWSLSDAEGVQLGSFDWVILTTPAAQTAMLAEAHVGLRQLAANTKMLGCFALMLGFDTPQPLPWQAALVRDAHISWVSVNSSKPNRGRKFTLVVHSTNAWAEAHIDDDIGAVREHLVAEVSRITGVDCGGAAHCDIQRWRYANIDRQRGPAYFVEASQGIAACGDWFIRGRIEAAFTSAKSLLDEIGPEFQ